MLETGTATSTAKLELAKATAALGEHLTPVGTGSPPVEAAEALRAAYLLVGGCGAAGLRARVERALTRGGPEIPSLPERTSLTTTERRIVEMSLDGAFDQEIAQALFITPPTVRQTLETVYRRLGVTSAQQLRMASSAH